MCIFYSFQHPIYITIFFFFPVANIRWGVRWDFGSAWEFCRFFKNSSKYSYRSPIDAQFVKMLEKVNKLINQMLAVCSVFMQYFIGIFSWINQSDVSTV